MILEEKLLAFLWAETDWSKPINECDECGTDKGLCKYFLLYQGIPKKDVTEFLMPLWVPYKTKKDDKYHFCGYGTDPQGRAERLEVIRKIIKELRQQYDTRNN